MEVSRQVLFSGAVTGLTYAVMAVGVILIFRSTRVINFAIGEMGAFSAALLYRLVIDWDVPTGSRSSPASRSVRSSAPRSNSSSCGACSPRHASSCSFALIGAAQLLLFFQLILPDITQVRPYPTAFSKSWEIGGVIVRSEELTVLIVIPILVVALSLFVNRTKYGLAIRASAANADAARLAAVNIKQMSTLVWVLAGTLAATAAMLFAPLNPAGSVVPRGRTRAAVARAHGRADRRAWRRCRSRWLVASRSA